MNVLIVEDHPVMLEGLTGLVAQAFPGCQTQHADSFSAAQEALGSGQRIDLVLMDPGLPDLHGSAAVRAVVVACTGGPVVVVSANDQAQDVQMAWEAGARAFLSKAALPQDIVGSLQEVAQGKRVLLTRRGRASPPRCDQSEALLLSERQLEVLRALCEGCSNKEVAQRLQIAEKTVKAHVGAIFDKLGVVNRTQASMLARRLGLFEEAPPPAHAQTWSGPAGSLQTHSGEGPPIL